MTKFSNKPGARSTKRVTLKNKYKVQKKVRDHGKKLKKEANKMKKLGIYKKNSQKDVGLPNLYPFKAQVVEAIERKKKHLEEQKKEEKLRKKELKRLAKEEEKFAENYVSLVKELLEKVEKNELLIHYKIADFNDVTEFLTNVAVANGKLNKGGVADIQAAAKIVLDDVKEGAEIFKDIDAEIKQE